MDGRRGILSLVIACLLACSAAAIAAEPGPVFPPPPAQARLAYRGDISDLSAFEQPRGLIDRLKDWVGGKAELPRLVRPHGVSAGDGYLLVADPEAGYVHRFCFDDSTWSRLPAEERLAHPIDAAAGPGGVVFISDPVAAQVVACDAEGRLLFACEGPFKRPAGLVWDAANERLLVADTGAHHLVAVDGAGRHRGEIGTHGDGPGQFNHPIDLAIGPGGRILVLDAMNHRIQVLGAGGEFKSEFGTQGDGPGHLARPRGLCADGAGRVLVTDAVQDNFQIFDATGRLLLAVGRTGHEPGAFWMPAGVAADGSGHLFVADAYNRRVQVFAYLDAADEGAQKP